MSHEPEQGMRTGWWGTKAYGPLSAGGSLALMDWPWRSPVEQTQNEHQLQTRTTLWPGWRETKTRPFHNCIWAQIKNKHTVQTTKLTTFPPSIPHSLSGNQFFTMYRRVHIPFLVAQIYWFQCPNVQGRVTTPKSSPSYVSPYWCPFHSSFHWQLDTTWKHEGKSLHGELSNSVGQYVCLLGIILSVDVGRPSSLWVVPFPRLGLELYE